MDRDDLSEDLIRDDVSDESETFNQIMEIYKKEVKNKKSYRSTKLPPNVAQLMGEANQHFMFHKFDEAIHKAYDIISKYPDYPEPYHLLGLIYEEQSNNKKAAHFYTLAAQLTQSESKLWEKIGYLYKESYCFELASYSFGRALKSDPNNKMLMVERAECYELAGDIRKAIKAIEKFISNNHKSDNLLIVKKCAKLYTKINQVSKSIELLESVLKRDDEYDYNIMNMICELYLKEEKFDKCFSFIAQCMDVNENQIENNFDDVVENLKDIPFLEIVLIFGICADKIGKEKYSQVAFELIIEDDVNDSAELFLEAAKRYEKMEKYQYSLQLYEKLLTVPDYQDGEIHFQLGCIYRKLERDNEAIQVFSQVLELQPDKYAAKIHLSEIYFKQERLDEAYKILQGNEYEQEERVYLSDDEENGKIAIDKQNNVKLHKRGQDEVDMEVRKKVKIQEDEEYSIPQPSQNKSTTGINDDLKPLKLTKESVEEKIAEIHKKYPIDSLILKFEQAQILYDQGQNQKFLEVIVGPLIKGLHLEIEIQEIRKKVLNRFLHESQKKNFKKKVESGMEFESGEAEQNVLLKTKKTKISNEPLQKRKTKLSTQLTEKQFENAQVMTKNWGKNKNDFYLMAQKTLRLLDESQGYKNISQICELLIKLKQEFSKDLPQFMNDIYIYGFISNYNLEEFEKAFYYIKFFSKNKTDDNFVQTLLSLCLQKIDDPAVYRVFMSKLQIKDMEKECEALGQILGNNYLQTGFYELGISTIHRLYNQDKENPFYNLLLSVAFLQAASSRTTQNKPQMVVRAFRCITKYLELRKNIHPCEAHYNIGRVYAQVSMLPQAIDSFEKSMKIHFDRQLTFDSIFKDNYGKVQGDNVFDKCVYNLVMIHKQLGNIEIAKSLMNDFMYIDE